MADTHMFPNRELTNFVDTCTDEDLTGTALLTKFKEDITMDSLSGCIHEVRRKLHDL